MSKPSKETLRRLAKASGGIQSRYGEHFGYHMSTVALERFAEAIERKVMERLLEHKENKDEL